MDPDPQHCVQPHSYSVPSPHGLSSFYTLNEHNNRFQVKKVGLLNTASSAAHSSPVIDSKETILPGYVQPHSYSVPSPHRLFNF